MEHQLNITPGYMESVPLFLQEIERIAIDNFRWAVFNPQQKAFLNKIRNRSFRQGLYHEFDIPKKSGGARHITAPTGQLKTVQKCVSLLLSAIYHPSENVHGFVAGKNIVTNADRHLNRKYVLNIDLKDFFPSVTSGMIIGSLMLLGFSKDVARCIAVICTKTVETEAGKADVLVQGSPASPVLANIACSHLDRSLSALAARHRLSYTRYADDMTFSSDHSVYAKGSEFMEALRATVESNGLQMNDKKTRLLKNGARQEVTGLTVGEKINVSRRYLKNLRAELFDMEINGFSEKRFRQVRGKIAFLQMVRGKEDPCVEKYKARLQQVYWFPMGMANYR